MEAGGRCFNITSFCSFGSHYEVSSGSYIHNWLSVWQQYGVISFLIYVFLLSFPVLSLMRLYFYYESKRLILPLALSFYCLLMVVVSKSFVWSYAGLSAGVYLYSLRDLKRSSAWHT